VCVCPRVTKELRDIQTSFSNSHGLFKNLTFAQPHKKVERP